MTPTRRLVTVALSSAVLAYAVGCTAGDIINAHSATDATPVTDTVFTSCDQLAHWSAVVSEHGTDAPDVWAALVSDGWTNPADGNVTILVPTGCAY